MKCLKTKLKKPKKEEGQLEFNFRENIIERYRKAREEVFNKVSEINTIEKIL